MRRIDPAFPDLLPVSFRMGPVPDAVGPVLDPVHMRLCWGGAGAARGDADTIAPRRPVVFLVHEKVARERSEELATLHAAGCGALLLLDGGGEPLPLPPPRFQSQVVALAVWLPQPWGDTSLPDLRPWRSREVPAGVLVGLGPAPDGAAQVTEGVRTAREIGADFVLSVPLSLTPQERHRVWDSLEGSADTSVGDLLFHTDLAVQTLGMERECSRACAELSLSEVLPGPATATLPVETAEAVNALLLWARRLDLLDGMGSVGWQLRRGARALLSSGKSPKHLMEEGNLRVIPGFTPWVESFARSLWNGAGEPFSGTRNRWLERS